MSLTYQEAYNKLRDEVYAPVYFTKLANAYGVRPADREEAAYLLNLPGKLRQAEEAELRKEAGRRQNVLARANDDLDQLLKQAGVTPANQYGPDETENVHKVAADLAADASLREAALVYQDFLAQARSQAAK